ncbi:MAG: FAD-dependent oxidoreductase [Desulfovibrio sp.]|jgi:NADPH-dependent 2,4-dienoyl-CoA reductase/sulfur reductase-like enzyme/rhodanese-related sulfurtransferase|nr:FAD-dependent oxidoreductase [Desulfovibrio sp.]
MAQNILIIGGVALGPKAACRCKRLLPDANVVLVDENTYISYGGCGIPYYVSGEIARLDDLRSTPYNTVRDPDFFRTMKGVAVRTGTRAIAVHRAERTVTVRDLATGREEDLPYDRLVLATGARPRVPDIQGLPMGNVLTLTNLEHADEVRRLCEAGNIANAVVIGGGFIGLEAAVALTDLWGVKTTVLEMMDQVLPGALSPTMARMALEDMRRHGVDVFTGERVVRFEGEGNVRGVVTDARRIDADLVILSAGFIPNSELAKAAGLEVAPFGGVIVDDHMRTSDPNIYAGGDCAAVTSIITGKPGYLPLGSMANRQGRVIGTNIAGGDATFPGFVGSWAVKLFDLSFCGAGLTADRARKEGFDAMGVGVEQLDRAHFYPEKHMLGLELVVDRKTGRVLGIQGASPVPDAIKARVDAVAAVLQHARPTVGDISNLEVCYAPPFASAMDVVNVVGNVAENCLAGRMHPVTAEEFANLWEKRAENGVFFIDTRPAVAGRQIESRHPEWHAIPLEEIEAHVGDIPKDRPVALVCNTGLRAYDSGLILARHGIGGVTNVMGGMQALGKIGFEP